MEIWPSAMEGLGVRAGRMESEERNVADRQFWNGKKVFLTGHTGFKGSWLSLWLHELGAGERADRPE